MYSVLNCAREFNHSVACLLALASIIVRGRDPSDLDRLVPGAYTLQPWNKSGPRGD